jgi:uncharacterized protein (TIGR02265 family)
MESSLAIQTRIGRCRPEHTLMGFFFVGALEHLERRAGHSVATEVRSQVPCMQKRFVPVLFYPVADYLRLLQLGAQALVSRGMTFSAAVEELGYGAADSFFASYVGKMLLVVAGKDPHQGLSGAPTVASMTTHFGQREYQRVAANRARFILRGEFRGLAWTLGLFRSGVERVLGRPGIIEVEPGAVSPFLDFTLDIRW